MILMKNRLKTSLQWELASSSPLWFSEKDLTLFLSDLELVTYELNEYLLPTGAIEHYVYFIVEGTLKSTVVNLNQPTCVDFATEGTIFCSFASLITRQPSQLSIQALSKVIVYRLSYDTLYDRPSLTSRHQRFTQKLAESFYLQSFTQTIRFAGLDAQARYQSLLLAKPAWLSRIPIKDLATYLGIHPESLSRLRRKMYDKDK